MRPTLSVVLLRAHVFFHIKTENLRPGDFCGWRQTRWSVKGKRRCQLREKVALLIETSNRDARELLRGWDGDGSIARVESERIA